ncbi:hypothetical protein M3Y95_00178900 [Aphelenchoides besseyi]|nr:hypothetical protein M3Y95_00178900 [Aphelenchoides besseyi]
MSLFEIVNASTFPFVRWIRKQIKVLREGRAKVNVRRSVKILFPVVEFKNEIYYAFGVFCLLSWLAFNLFILREFLCCIDVYTEDGLNQKELDARTKQIMVQSRVGLASGIPTSIGAPAETRALMLNTRTYSVFSLNSVVVKK